MITKQNPAEKFILVVDNSEDNLCLMQFILEAENYQVQLADSGKEALKKVKENKPHLILLDMMMPGMDGYEVIYQLHQEKDLLFLPPIFLVTADKYISVNDALTAGANGLIYKPIDLNELVSKVELALGNS